MSAPAIPATMTALLQHGPAGASDFKLGTTATPVPSAGEVLLRVHAASLNPIDLKRAGFVPQEVYPVVAGYDVAGVVVALAPDVTTLALGDRVFADIMTNAVGLKVRGSVAEYCLCPAHLLVPIPDALSFEHAAALPLVSMTAIQAFRALECKEGHNVFISAGAGGVGIHAIQIAKHMFAAGRVATTASGPKIDFVKQYGADVVVDYKQDDAGEKLRAWADGVLDCVGDLEAANKIKNDTGKVVSIVVVQEPGVGLMLQPTKEMLEKTAQLAADGKLVAVLDSVHPLEDAAKAMEKLAAGRAKGKIVIKVVA